MTCTVNWHNFMSSFEKGLELMGKNKPLLCSKLLKSCSEPFSFMFMLKLLADQERKERYTVAENSLQEKQT